VEMQHTGDSGLQAGVRAVIEHVFGRSAGDWALFLVALGNRGSRLPPVLHWLRNGGTGARTGLCRNCGWLHRSLHSGSANESTFHW